MRIAHVCLAAFYIDGFGYQENILPRIHKTMGHEVEIIASTENYIGNTQRTFGEARSYLNEDGIPVHRLAFADFIPRAVATKVRAYKGLTEHLERLRPDLIFVHDTQFWDLLKIACYATRNDIPVAADCHTDYVNSARGFISREILHRIFYRWIIRRCDPAISKYWATLPMRATFLQEMYGLPKEKIDLLPFGVDDTQLTANSRDELRREQRNILGIPDGSLTFVTGGKLDRRKNIHVLMDRFSALHRDGRLGEAHLVVFGQPDEAMVREIAAMPLPPSVHMIGWVNAKDISALLLAGDIAVFPGTHSVLWEQAIGLGLPCVFHRWPGMEHLDLGGNAIIVEDAAPETLDALLQELAAPQSEKVSQMRRIAMTEGPQHFAYSAIAERAIREFDKALHEA